MTIKEALDDIVTSGINLGAGDFVSLEALEVAASVLEKMQWISVKDRLPEWNGDNDPYVKCLIYMPAFDEIGVGEYSLGENCWRFRLLEVTVTHWMPLPGKPEEVNDAESID